MIHSYFSSSFNQIVENQNYNKLLKLKTDAKKRERETMRYQILTWKTSEEIKNNGPTTDRKHSL